MTRCLTLLIVLLALAHPAGAAPIDEPRLDPGLQILYRSQLEERAAGPDRARQLMERLRRPGLAARRAVAGAAPFEEAPLLLLVRFQGDPSRLEAIGFAVQSRIGEVYAGTLPSVRLGELARLPGVRCVQASQELRVPGIPQRAGSRWPTRQRSSAAAPSGAGGSNRGLTGGNHAGAGALVAFIDTGVDVFHQDFRHPDGTTRIRALLDLSDPGDLDGNGTLDGTGPFGGTLHSETEINAALLAGTFDATDPTGHGTHGLSVATGDDPAFPGGAATVDLLVVKATREAGSLGFLSTDLVNALAFVDSKAAELGLPYVVNLSLGTAISSHDGRSLEEQALDALVGPGIPGKAAVVAAGNSSENGSSRFHHFRGTSYVGIATGHTLTVPTYTPAPGPGNDRILLDVWYEGQDRLTLTVTPPGCPPVIAVYGSFADVQTACGDVFVANMGGANPENADTEAVVLIDDWSGVAPAAGSWEISLAGEEISLSGIYDGWLADDSAVGAEHPFLSANADNLYLVGKPGGAYHAITVGSYAAHGAMPRYRTSWVDVHGATRLDSTAVVGDVSDFSSPGPTRDGRVKPELTAPGERVMGAVSRDALPGVSPASIYRLHPWFPAEPDALLIDATANHAFGMLQGTSFAAPVVTGVVANLLATDPTLDAIQIRNVLAGSALTDSFTGGDPDERWGYGKLDESVGHAPLPGTLRVDQDELPAAVVDQLYGMVLTASGGTVPYTWWVTAGSPPPGLSFTGSLLAGTPTTPGTYSFTVSVRDAGAPQRSTSRAFALAVAATPPLEIASDLLPRAQMGKAYDQPVLGEGGQPPYTWSLAGGSLPPGLTLTADRIQGTPSAVGVFNFTVRLGDAAAAAVFRSLKIRVTLAGAGLWEQLGAVATEVTAVAVHPHNPDRLFASTRNIFDDAGEGVFVTDDAGLSWRSILLHNGLPLGTINANQGLLVSPATGAVWVAGGPYYYNEAANAWIDTMGDSGRPEFDTAGNVYVMGGNSSFARIRRSTDQGASWVVVGDPGACFGSLRVFPANPSFLYTFAADAFTGSSVCRSTDGGATWAEIHQQVELLADLHVSPSNPLDLVAAFLGGNGHYIQRSTDGGLSWSQYPVPRGGYFCCMARAPSAPAVILYATVDGLSKSTDHGQTWVSLQPGDDPQMAVSSLAIDPSDANRFWVGSASGLYGTSDGGETWVRRNRGLIQRGLTDLAINPTVPSELLLAASAGEPYLSRSGGSYWTLAGTRLSGKRVTQPVISAADPNLYLIHGDDSGLFRSQDRGLTWTWIGFSWSTDVAIAADPFDADNILVGSRGHEVWRSTDRGATWVQTAPDHSDAFAPNDIAFARDVPGRAFWTSNSALWRSSDGGATWSIELSIGDQWSPDRWRLVEPAPSDSRHVYAYGGSGIFFLAPSQPWQAATTNPDLTVTSLAAAWDDPQKAFAGGSHPGTPGSHGGIFRTTDGGRNWTRLPGSLDSYTVVGIVTHPAVPGTLYAATDLGGVFRSNDDGATWSPLDKYGTVADLVNLTLQDPTNPNLLFAGTEGYGVQASTDKGRSWAPRVAGLANFNVNALAFDPGDPALLYAGTGAGVFKSIDSGTTWAATALGSGRVTDMVTDNEGGVRRIWSTVAGQGVAFSADGGASFSLYADGLASLDLSSIELEDKGAAKRIWITSRGGDGVAFSDDLGQTWVSAAGNGLTDREINDLAIDGVAGRIWIAGDDGVFFSDDGQVWTELSLGLPGRAPVTSVSIDPNSQEVLVSLFSHEDGGVYRGGNVHGIWSAFSDGLDELQVSRLTRDAGHAVDLSTLGTTFYASTAGDGVYSRELRTEAGTVPAITTADLPGGLLRTAYSVTLAATGGQPPYSWSLAEGTLPPGLRLDGSTGVISGEPGLAGTFTTTFQVADISSRRSRKEFTVRIDDPNVPVLSVSDVAVGEGTAGTVAAVFTVSLSFADTASVGYRTASGTATEGVDFVAAEGTLDFLPPVTSRTVTVQVKGDTVPESAETFSLLLRDPLSARIGDGLGIGTITNDASWEGAFFTVTPCRLFDSRLAGDGPALGSGLIRLVQVAGKCGIPNGAKSASINIAVIQSTGAGHLQVFPGNLSPPATSTVSFAVSSTRANNAIAGLATDASGKLALRPVVAGAGTVHVIVDVTGYFL